MNTDMLINLLENMLKLDLNNKINVQDNNIYITTSSGDLCIEITQI